eukprot:11943154-Alexandrium_andersonii.AAC.1
MPIRASALAAMRAGGVPLPDIEPLGNRPRRCRGPVEPTSAPSVEATPLPRELTMHHFQVHLPATPASAAAKHRAARRG